MNKTVYIRDEDEPIWDRVRELAGAKGVSSVIVDGLKRFIVEKEAEEAESKGFGRITVEFNDADAHYVPKIKAFYGKWIISPTKPERGSSEDGEVYWSYSIALTAKGAAVFYWVQEERESRSQRFRVFPSLEAAAADPEANWTARKAMEIIGVPVEELDI